MASTYVNDLRLNEMATGDQSGSWGTVTNTNLELIGEAFSYGTEAITTNADTHATTIADGASDAGRAMFLKYTGTLDSTCTITIGPNTVSKMWFIENATTGSQDIIISQGSGANVTIAAGQTKAVYSDGAGSGAAFVDAFAALDVGSLAIAGTLVTSTATEINYVDGVTSAVQTQLDAKVIKTADTGAAVIPAGTEAERDGSPAAGYLRFNSDATSFEGYDGSAWGSIGGGATEDAIYENSATISENITIATGRNGMSTGPISVDDGITVTVSDGARYVVI
jgi:hypothetical protein